MLVLIIVVVAQIVFSGALLPLKQTIGHQFISPFLSNRWVVDGLINLVGIGDPLIQDECWTTEDGPRPKDDEDGVVGWNTLLNEKNEEKQDRNCACMGSAIFEECRTASDEIYPGVLNPDFYTDDAQVALGQDEPEQPPTPTPLPSPTPLFTPTPLPTATPDAENPPMNLSQCQEQAGQQCDDYIDDLMAQQDEYSDEREEQMEDYQDERQEQMEDYQDSLTDPGGWSDEKQTWAENRQRAISSAEGVLKNMFDSYDYAFEGEVYTRWAWIGVLGLGLLGLIIVFQKRKDVV